MARKIITITLAFFVSLSPILGFGIFIIVLFATNDSLFFKYILPGLILLLSLYISKEIFSAVMSRGFIDFFSHVDRTPEADDLYNTGTILSVERYVENFKNGKHLFRSGCIELWGDTRGRELNIRNQVREVYLNEETLSIEFTNFNKLLIIGADKIIDDASFFKIIHAKNIIWLWENGKANYKYENTGRNIITTSNFKWKSRKLDVMLQCPAVFMYQI